MQDAAQDLANHAAMAAQNSSHNASLAAVSVFGGASTVATAAAQTITSDFWLHFGHASIVFGFLLCISGLVRFYWDVKDRINKRRGGR